MNIPPPAGHKKRHHQALIIEDYECSTQLGAFKSVPLFSSTASLHAHCKLQSFVSRGNPYLVHLDAPGEPIPASFLRVWGRHALANTSLEHPFKSACEALNSSIQSKGTIQNDQRAALDRVWFGGLKGKRTLKGMSQMS
jgi:hypothetical protein